MPIGICCRDGCGLEVIGANYAEAEKKAGDAGWAYQHIRGGGYRCGACERALLAAQTLAGAPAAEAFVDRVPRHSRGALPKETASTILPPFASGRGSSGALDWDDSHGPNDRAAAPTVAQGE